MQISVALRVYRAFHFSPNQPQRERVKCYYLIERISLRPIPSSPRSSLFSFHGRKKKENSNEITRDIFIRRRREAKKRVTLPFFFFSSIPSLSRNAWKGSVTNILSPVDKEGGEARNKSPRGERGENRVTLGKSGLIPSKTILATGGGRAIPRTRIPPSSFPQVFPRSLSSPRLLITGSNFYEGEIWRRPVYNKPMTEGQGRYRERGYGATMVKSLEGCISLAGRASGVARNDCRTPEAILQEHVIHY